MPPKIYAEEVIASSCRHIVVSNVAKTTSSEVVRELTDETPKVMTASIML